MKNKFFLILLLFLFSNFVAKSQIILKRNALKKQLFKIDTLIQLKQYEKAMLLFDSKEKIIAEENVSKKSKELYTKIKNIIQDEKVIFDNTKAKVEKFKNEYSLKHYCKSIELVDIELNNENSYLETQQLKNSLLSDLIAAKEKCNDYTEKIKQWKLSYKNSEYEKLYSLLKFDDAEKDYFFENDLNDFNELITNLKAAKEKSDNYAEKIKQWKLSNENKEYEKLYSLLKFDDAEKHYFFENDLKDFDELITNLKKKHTIYAAVSDYLANEITNAVSNIDYKSLKYEQAKSLIDTLTITLTRADEKIKEAPGLNPELENIYQLQRKEVIIAIKKLKTFAEEHIPAKTVANKSINYSKGNYSTDTLDFKKIIEAMSLFKTSDSLNMIGKPAHSEKYISNAKQILNKILISNKKYFIPLTSIFVHFMRDEYKQNYMINKIICGDNNIRYFPESFNNNYKDYYEIDFQYTSTKDIDYKLEELMPEKNYTLSIQITPYNQYGITTYDYSYGSLTIYIKVLDVK